MMKLESLFSFFGFADVRRPPPPVVAPAAVADPVAAKRGELRAKIAEYADLPDDWDGDNGRAPAQQDIDNALSLIDRIPDAGIASAEPMTAGDGDVGFVWEEDGLDMEVGFMNGNISFYGYTPDGERIGATQKCGRGEMPEKLQQLFAAVFPG